MEEVSIRGDGTRFSTARMAPSGVVIPTVVDPSSCQLGALSRLTLMASIAYSTTCQLGRRSWTGQLTLEETSLDISSSHTGGDCTYLRGEGVDTSVVLGSRINVSGAKKEDVESHTSLGT